MTEDHIVDANKKVNDSAAPFSPWEWQSRFIDAAESVYGDGLGSSDFLAVVTPGGGKTKAAVALATQLPEMESLVVVVPTLHVKRQWQAVASGFGYTLSDLDNIRSNHFVTTYAQVVERKQFLSDIIRTRRSLVVFDEIHHASSTNKWGESANEAFRSAWRRLGLTGTPFRTDSSPIPFVSYDEDGVCRPDFVFGYQDAVSANPQIVRSVAFRVFDGEIGWRVKGEEEMFRKFSDDLKKRDQKRRLRAALDPSGGFLRDMLSAADARLRDYPGQGGLVIARDIQHANALASLLHFITGEEPTLVHTKTETPAAKIDAFRNGYGRWLVSVQMVSEGVDIPRLRVLAYATNYSTDMYFRQAVGRVVRGQGEADVFVPNHPEFLRLVEEIEDDKLHTLAEQDRALGAQGSGIARECLGLTPLGSFGEEAFVVRTFIAPPQNEGLCDVALESEKLQRLRAKENQERYKENNRDRYLENHRSQAKKRMEDPDRRRKVYDRHNEQARRKYAENEDYRGKVLARGLARRERYYTDPEYRAKEQRRHREYKRRQAERERAERESARDTSFPCRLKEVRLSRGVSTYVLYKEFGIPSSLISGWESGATRPRSHNYIQRVAMALRVPLACLQEPVGHPIPPAEDYSEGSGT